MNEIDRMSYLNACKVIVAGGRDFENYALMSEKLNDLFECIMQVPEIDEMLSPALAIVPLQLLAYYIAEFLGKDVDQPRNLAKSVTVE